MAPLAFGETLQERINARAIDLLSGTIPEVLAHYTSCKSVGSIAAGHTLWATCLADQQDETELKDAICILQRCATRAKPDASELGRLVLQNLPDAISERRQWLFITCFCADSASRFHFDKYGRYRLDVPVHNARGLSIRPDMFQSDCWIRPCIYDHALFTTFGDLAMRDVISALRNYSDGELLGPWAKSIALRIARDVAQILLTVAASVKHPGFQDDQEIRIICSPPAGIANSAPSSLDKDFMHWIKTADLGSRSVRYVELWKYPRSRAGRDDAPFLGVLQDPFAPNEDERQLLNRILDRNTDVLCQ